MRVENLKKAAELAKEIKLVKDLISALGKDMADQGWVVTSPTLKEYTGQEDVVLTDRVKGALCKALKKAHEDIVSEIERL